MAEIWFWQGIVTPHMAALAAACAAQGHRVTYVAQCAMRPERAQLGWSVPEIAGVDVRLAGDAVQMRRLAAEAPQAAHHLFQGLRGNGLLAVAQRQLRRRGMRQWVVMETVKDVGWSGRIKRALYRALLLRWRAHLHGVLAIGADTPAWVMARGMPAQRVFPFAYFLAEPEAVVAPAPVKDEGVRPVRLLFVGQLIPRKRLDLLLGALARLQADDQVLGKGGFSLQVIGDGPQRAALQQQAARLGVEVDWRGVLPMPQARAAMAQADGLVLPSSFDGWGAVISEALMAGTPVICSETCGAAGAVRASGEGGVFAAGDEAALAALLAETLRAGPRPIHARRALAHWARCLGAEAGADYLLRILAYAEGRAPRPSEPWQPRAGNVPETDACVA